MTMPKKGRRKITVNNKKYYYMIKPLFFGANMFKVVIQEAPNGKTYSHPKALDTVTPSFVATLILEHLAEENK